MKQSQKIYNLYRQAIELQSALKEEAEQLWQLKEAGRVADNLCDLIFDCVGKAAAYEIDNDNRKGLP